MNPDEREADRPAAVPPNPVPDHSLVRCSMRFYSGVVSSLLVASSVASAQDASHAVADGGIKVAGWQGKIDPTEAKRGGKLEGAKLEKVGNDLQVTTGPAVAYWNPSNVAKGSYTVKATFTEA
jgi:hypothetical protein